MIKHPRHAEVVLADDERLIETRDASFWNPCADPEWAYVGVPLSSCDAVDGPREVKKIDCTGLLTESVQAMFQEIVKAFVEDEGFETGEGSDHPTRRIQKFSGKKKIQWTSHRNH